jgi:hypothetical protein
MPVLVAAEYVIGATLPPSTLSQGEPTPTVTKDQMIEETQANHFARRVDPSRKGEILHARCRIAAGMSVKENHACCTPCQSSPQQGPRLDRSTAQGAAKYLAVMQQTIPAVEIEGTHNFLSRQDIS